MKKDAESQDTENTETESQEQQTESLADVISGSLEIESDEGKPGEKEAGDKEEGEKTSEEGEGDEKQEGEKQEDKQGEEGKDDDLLAPLDDDVNERTKERFEKLTTNFKETRQQLDQVNEQFEGLKTAITEVATPQEFGDALDYLGNIKSGDPNRLKAALQVVEYHRMQIYQALGQEAPGIDLLKDHADLTDKVDSMEISREDALEIAKSRRVQTQQARAQQQQEAAQQNQTQYQDRVNAGINAISQFETQMAAKDIDFAAKRKILEAQIPNIIQTIPPEGWVSAIQTAYNVIGSGQQQSRPGRQQQPITNNSGRGGKPEIKSTEDALMNMFGFKD